MPVFAESESPLDMFYHWESSKPDAVYLRQPVDQVWHDYRWRDVGEEARRMAAALRGMGLAAGERVSILSKNCAHWVIADLATMMAGYSSAPVFTSMAGEDVRYILEHSDCRVLFVGECANWPQVRKILSEKVTVISLPFTEVPGADCSWNELLASHQALAGNPTRPGHDEITTVYTSGSTGVPKGVVYSFEAAGHIVRNLGQTFRMSQQDRLISYLPLAHGFERAVIAFMSLYAGCTIGFNENQDTFGADMHEVRPTVFQCVPRLWTKFQESVQNSFGGQEGLAALLDDPGSAETTRMKVKQALGLDQGRLLMTGSAPTPMPLHEWYEALDMPLCEIYGQSEILSGSSNLPWDRKPGTLGKPTVNTELKIADNGEILIRAKAVMSGYLHEPQKTEETLVDGWIHTGDKGEMDEDGFLKITGRVKEIFKTTKGKYVAPLPIESRLFSNLKIEQMCLVGSGLPQTALLVQLSAHGETMDQDALQRELRQDIIDVNAELDGHEKIACVIVSAKAWNPDNGLVTHTMKIKRAALENRYGDIAENAFSIGASVKQPLVMFEEPELNSPS